MAPPRPSSGRAGGGRRPWPLRLPAVRPFSEGGRAVRGGAETLRHLGKGDDSGGAGREAPAGKARLLRGLRRLGLDAIAQPGYGPPQAPGPAAPLRLFYPCPLLGLLLGPAAGGPGPLPPPGARRPPAARPRRQGRCSAPLPVWFLVRCAGLGGSRGGVRLLPGVLGGPAGQVGLQLLEGAPRPTHLPVELALAGQPGEAVGPLPPHLLQGRPSCRGAGRWHHGLGASAAASPLLSIYIMSLGGCSRALPGLVVAGLTGASRPGAHRPGL